MVEALVILSTLLFIGASPPYILDTVRGHTKPERATWLIWTVLGLIAFVAQLRLGATWSLFYTGLDTLGSLLVFCLAIKWGVGGWTLIDRIGLAVAGIGVVISLVARQPVIAIIGVILADFAGTFLTIRKTFQAPNSETTISWLFTGSGALCSVLLVRSVNIGLLLYPVYLTLANYSIPVTQLMGRVLRRREPA